MSDAEAVLIYILFFQVALLQRVILTFSVFETRRETFKRVNLSSAPFVTLLYPYTLDVLRALRPTRMISRVTKGDHIVNDKNYTVTDATIDFP